MIFRLQLCRVPMSPAASSLTVTVHFPEASCQIGVVRVADIDGDAEVADDSCGAGHLDHGIERVARVAVVRDQEWCVRVAVDGARCVRKRHEGPEVAGEAVNWSSSGLSESKAPGSASSS